jgi:hypothetical protein
MFNKDAVSMNKTATIRLLVVAVVFAAVNWTHFHAGQPAIQPTAHQNLPLIDRLAQQIMSRSSDQLEAAKTLNSWIFQSLSHPAVSTNNKGPLDSLERLEGFCGDRDLIFAAVAQRMGIKARRVNFFSIPYQIAHTATEVEIAKKWYFFDSSFGVYLSDPGDPKTPLSISEARQKYPNVALMRVPGPAWVGKWLSVEALSDYKSTSLGKPILHPQTKLYPVLDPLVSYLRANVTFDSPSDVYVEDVFIALEKMPDGKIGKTDGNHIDLARAYHDTGGGASYLPFIHVIGAYSIATGPRVEHKYLLLANKKTNVDLKIKFVSPIPMDLRRHFVFRLQHSAASGYERSNYSLKENWDKSSVSISVRAVPPVSIVQIRFDGPSRQLRIDSVLWTSDHKNLEK